MTWSIRLLLAASAVAALPAGAQAQQRTQPTPAQPGPQLNLAPGVTTTDDGATQQPCDLTDVFMTPSGIGFLCDYQTQGLSNVVVTSTGDGDTARLSAVAAFIMHNHGSRSVPVYSRPAETRVCAEAAPSLMRGKTCHELVQIGPARRTSGRN